VGSIFINAGRRGFSNFRQCVKPKWTKQEFSGAITLLFRCLQRVSRRFQDNKDNVAQRYPFFRGLYLTLQATT
jgi:hypothetical protein